MYYKKLNILVNRLLPLNGTAMLNSSGFYDIMLLNFCLKYHYHTESMYVIWIFSI